MWLRSKPLILLTVLIALAPLLSTAQASQASSCEAAFGQSVEPHFSEPANYVDKLKRLQEPEGGTPLGQIVSRGLNPSPDYKGRELRGEFGDKPPAALADLIPRLGTREFIMKSSVDPVGFYQSVYRNYGQRFPEELLNQLSEADRALLFERTTLGIVRSRDAVIGTWRWYEANPILSGSPKKTPRDFFERIPVPLPFQLLNKVRGVGPLQISETLSRYMQMGVGVTEISKFSAASASHDERERAVHLIELKWKSMAKWDDIYIAHVTTFAHARLYQKYGFEIAEVFEVQDSPDQKPHKEAILWVRGWQFEDALVSCLNVVGQTTRLRPETRLLPAEFKAPNFFLPEFDDQ